MRLEAAIFATSFSFSLALKLSARSGRSLRVEVSPPVSCPNDMIPPSIVNAVVSTRENINGITELVYRCAHGLVASGTAGGADSPREFVVNCRKGSDGRITSRSDITCVPGQCNLGPFTRLRHATLSLPGTGASVDSIITVTCEAGHTIDGLPTGPRSRQVSCDQDLKLVPFYSQAEDNDCKPITCGRLSVPDNAVIRSNHKERQTVEYGDVVQFSCVDGYFFKPAKAGVELTKASFTKTCDLNGNLVNKDDPTSLVAGECVPMRCGPIPHFEGADVVAKIDDVVRLNSEIAYVCKRGLHFVNSTRITPIPVSSSDPWIAVEKMIPHMTSFKVACIADGHEGSAIYDTDPAVGRCEPEICTMPLAKVPGNIKQVSDPQSRYFVGDTVEYECANGFLYRGKAPAEGKAPEKISATCNDEKEWVFEENIDVCSVGSCGTVADVPFTYLNNTKPTLDDVAKKMGVDERIEYECYTGFSSSTDSESDTISVVCTGRGEFVANSFCKRRCGPLPKPPRNTIASLKEGGKYEIGSSITSVATFTCNEGFSVNGNPLAADNSNIYQQIQCSDNPDFGPFEPALDTLKECLPITCGLPQSIAKARWVTDNKVKQYLAGEVMKYTCEPTFGVELGGGKMSTTFDVPCLSSGWKIPTSDCKRITCDSAPRIAHGRVIGPINNGVVNAGETIEVECSEGFFVPGSTRTDQILIKCSDNGDYLPSNYGKDMCKPIQCPDLPETLMGAVKASGVTALKFGDAPVEYKCNPAWKLPPIKVKCQVDNTYEITGEECKEPRCATVPDALRYTVSRSANGSVGEQAVMSCKPGYMTKEGALEFKVECIGPGTWIPLNVRDATGCSLSMTDTEPILVR